MEAGEAWAVPAGQAVADSAAMRGRIEEMVRRIVAQFAPDRIMLFGPHARGSAGLESAVDLLVIKPVTGSIRAERLAIRVALRGLGVAKNVILVTPEEAERSRGMVGTVTRAAFREGKVVYERPG